MDFRRKNIIPFHKICDWDRTQRKQAIFNPQISVKH